MRPSLDRALASVRAGVGALALAVALLLLFRLPLIATFRAALIVLAALEVLAFGRRALSAGASVTLWIELAVKLAVLATAYAVLGS
jgi:hypothetical protein